MKLNLNFNVEVTKEDIELIIEMAGFGIDYWCYKGIVGDDYYKVYTDDGLVYKLSYYDISHGVALYIEHGNHPYNILIDEGGWKINADVIDSEVADMIIQYACFNEIIYG